MKNTLSVEVSTVPFSIGLSGMKLRKLKFIMYMITLYGTWHGIPSDIFFVVVAMITPQSFGVGIGQGTLLVINLTWVRTKVMVNKMLPLLAACLEISLCQKDQQLQDHLLQD